MTNRLADSTSPYLLQHKDNPVDWWQWGDEAFAESKRRDVPVLLSVGYAACHWCHVMAHESFEDEPTAEFMNDHFVCVKVDREERPDVDAVYMDATQAMTGSGGWPMTCWLTPTGEPFYCGTYFPNNDRHGMPSFMTVMTAVIDAWTTKPDQLLAAGADIVRQLTERSTPPASILANQPPTVEKLDIAAATALEDEDLACGGFGSAPKFPPSMMLEALLRHHARTGETQSLAAVTRTCNAMARGGIYDQLAGGFARYSVDARWTVPHFEKMLYDNAQLASVYLHLWRATDSELAKRIAVETCDWMIAELLTEEGLFAASLDADSLDETTGHSEEGAFYAWTPEQVGERAAAIFNVTREGTFEHGMSVLQLLEDPAEETEWFSERARLLSLRTRRPRPGRDDKVVTAWNGIAIGALAETGALLERPDLIEFATIAADQLLAINIVDGRIRRASRDGRPGQPTGVLDDHGCLAAGLLKLHQMTGVRRYLDEAMQILETAVSRFGDERDGGFFDTADDAEQLIRRPKDPSDGASPSGSSAMIDALITAAALTGRTEFRERADRGLAAISRLIERAPRFAGLAWSAAEASIAGPLEVAVVDDSDLARTARLTTSPGAVVVTQGDSPLLADRPRPAAYICRNFTCDAPVTEDDVLRKRLGVYVR